MDSVDVPTALLLPQLAHRREVLPPIAAADNEHGEGLAGQEFSCLVRLEKGAQRHARGSPPSRGADADQVVVPVSHRIRGADLPTGAARLGRKHTEHVGPHTSHREAREPFGESPVGELDLGLLHIAPSVAKYFSRGLEDFECLPRIGVVEKQDPWPPVTALLGRVRHYCISLISLSSPRWFTARGKLVPSSRPQPLQCDLPANPAGAARSACRLPGSVSPRNPSAPDSPAGPAPAGTAAAAGA